MYKEIFIEAPTEASFERNKENISDESIVFHKEVDIISVGDKEWVALPENNLPIRSTLVKSDNGLYWDNYRAMYNISRSTSQTSNMNGSYKIQGNFGKNNTPLTNIVSWVRANSHRYVGTYDPEQGMLLKQLDDFDGTKYTDGTDASIDITTKDVFMKMPDFWYRIEYVSLYSNTIEVTVSNPNDSSWIKWDGNTLIGVYEASCEDSENNSDGELYSRSGAYVSDNITADNFKAKARNRSSNDDHFMLVTWETCQIMTLLYILYYGNIDSNNQIGYGGSLADLPHKICGETDLDGMVDSVIENTRSTNFWGLENWFGNSNEYIDNLKFISTREIGLYEYNNVDAIDKMTRPLAEDVEYDPDTDGYSYYYRYDANVLWVTMKKSKLDKASFLFFPGTLFYSNSGTDTLHFYQGYNTSTVGSPLFRGAMLPSGTTGGARYNLFSYGCNSKPTDAKARHGTRLQYNGRVKIID